MSRLSITKDRAKIATQWVASKTYPVVKWSGPVCIAGGRWVRRLFVAPEYHKDRDYLEAEAWLKTFHPSTDATGYDKALEYAWKKFDQYSSASEALDKKADNLMRNAGLVAGLLGLVLNTPTVTALTKPAYLIPSLIAFVISLIFAAMACKPTGGAASASVHDVLDDIGAGHTSDAWIAASLHCTIVGRKCLNDWKAARIRWATIALCVGLLGFLLPILRMLW